MEQGTQIEKSVAQLTQFTERIGDSDVEMRILSELAKDRRTAILGADTRFSPDILPSALISASGTRHREMRKKSPVGVQSPQGDWIIKRMVTRSNCVSFSAEGFCSQVCSSIVPISRCKKRSTKREVSAFHFRNYE